MVPVCCLCEQENETLEHLFFECMVARDVWNGVSRWCGIDRQVGDWNVEKEFLVTQCTTNSGKQRIYRCVVSIVIYHIWKERNQRRMQGNKCLVDDIVKQCRFILALCSQKDRKLARFFQV